MGCRSAVISVTAIIRKNEAGEEYVKFNKTQHICKLREFDREKFQDDIVVGKPIYDIVEKIVFGRQQKHLFIFTSTEKIMCYKFTYCNNSNYFYCSKCASSQNHIIHAHLCINKEGEEYISIRPKKHICQPREYLPYECEGKIIKAPEYQIFQRRNGTELKEKLIIFTSKERNFYYDYYLKGTKDYLCLSCRYQKINVWAKIFKNENNEEFVQIGWRKHVCKPRKYKPEDFNVTVVKKPNFIIEKCLKNGVENRVLIIFDSTNSDLCYKFSYVKREKKFHCRSCRTRCVTAKLLQDENGEEFLELNKIEHECQPKQYTGSRNINVFNNFKIETDGKDKKVLFIFNENDLKLCHVYHYKPSTKNFFCKKCDAKKHAVIAKLRQNQSGEDYLELGKNDHICEPEIYELFAVEGKKIFKPDFEILDNAETLIINDPKKNGLCYQYIYKESLKKYVCRECTEEHKKTISATILQNSNGEYYVVLGRFKHACQPK